MAYPFASQEQHVVYKNTFLQNTFAEFYFTPIVEKEWDGGSRLYSFLRKYFHVDAKKAWDEMENGVSLNNQDLDVTLHFSKDYALVRVGRKNYQAFATSVMPYLFLLKAYVKEVLARDAIKSLKVRKINLWPYDQVQSQKPLGDEDILKTFLSDELRKIKSDDKDSDGHVLNMCHFDQRETSLDIKYGIVKTNDVPAVVLDSTATSEQTQPTNLGEVESKLDELNNILYDAYHWSVTENVIRWMEGKEVEDVQD